MSINIMDLEYLKQYEFIGGWEAKGTVYLWYRENGERKIITIPNLPRYFCISKSDFSKISREDWDTYKKNGLYTKGIFENDYAIIYSDYVGPRQFWDEWLTNLDNLGVKPLEGDVTRLQRLTIDLDLKVASPNNENGPRIAFFDIETDDRGGKPRPGKDRVLSVGWIDKETEQEFFYPLKDDTDIAELELLNTVYEELLEYDVLIGYNNYNYDDVVLLEKFKHYELDFYKFKRLMSLDMFNIFERQGTFREYKAHNRKLDTIAKKVLGRGKLEHTEKIYEIWRTNQVLLKEYNLEDIRLIMEMEKHLKSANLYLGVCSISGLLYSSGYSPLKAIDSFLLHLAAQKRDERDFRYPTSYYRPEHKLGGYNSFSRNALPSDKRKGRKEQLEEFGIEYEEIEGALVLDVTPGLYKNVVVSDFNSLYPNTMRVYNIGLDTIATEEFDGPKAQSPNSIWYRTDIISGLARAVTILLDERKKVRNEMKNIQDERWLGMDIQQRSLKELANSMYGVSAQWGCRYYSKEIAESITGAGRKFLLYALDWYNSRNLNIVFGDTDSIAVSYDGKTENPEQMVKDYLEDLQVILKDSGSLHPEFLEMSTEKHLETLLIIAKKNYIAIDNNGKIETKGLQTKKGNVPEWSTAITDEFLLDILSGKHNSDYFERKILSRKRELIDGKVPIEKFYINARLGKELDEYKSQLAHVTIAKRLAEQGHLMSDYSTISYVVTAGETPIQGLADVEINGSVEIDGAYYFNHILMSQLERYLTVGFPEVDWRKFKFPKNSKRHPFQLKIRLETQGIENGKNH